MYLLEHAGEIVTRDELRSVLWPSDTYVDFDHSLNTADLESVDGIGPKRKQVLVIVGQKKALGIAVRNDQSRKRYSGLLSSLRQFNQQC